MMRTLGTRSETHGSRRSFTCRPPNTGLELGILAHLARILVQQDGHHLWAARADLRQGHPQTMISYWVDWLGSMPTALGWKMLSQRVATNMQMSHQQRCPGVMGTRNWNVAQSFWAAETWSLQTELDFRLNP